MSYQNIKLILNLYIDNINHVRLFIHIYYLKVFLSIPHLYCLFSKSQLLNWTGDLSMWILNSKFTRFSKLSPAFSSIMSTWILIPGQSLMLKWWPRARLGRTDPSQNYNRSSHYRSSIQCFCPPQLAGWRPNSSWPGGSIHDDEGLASVVCVLSIWVDYFHILWLSCGQLKEKPV